MIEWLRDQHLEPVIEIAGRTLPIELRRHPTARRLTLRLAPDGSAVHITLPRWCASKEAIAFAHARADWLAQQVAKVPQARDPVVEGAFDYRGHRVALEWAAGAPRKPLLAEEILRMGGPQDTLGKRLSRWLEAQALALFEEDADHYCRRAGLPSAPVRITRAKRRWGSCSSEGTLRLNWRLVQAPDHVRRSVVAHEVAHLVHFDHSPAFHALLDAIYEEDIEAANRWLSAKGRSLYAAFG